MEIQTTRAQYSSTAAGALTLVTQHLPTLPFFPTSSLLSLHEAIDVKKRFRRK
jgi:hypothetical protein